jgi:hydrogenase maturation protease
MNEMEIMLVGLGHEMHGDDEIGLEIINRWSEDHSERLAKGEVRIKLLESPGINLLGLIAGLDAAILVAAVHSGAPPGTIHVLKGEQLAALDGISRKGGGWGTAQALSLGYHLAPEDLPETLILIGIEGAAFGLGEGLSPAVRAAIPDALHVIDQTLKDITRKNNTFWQVIQQLKRIIPAFSRK